MTESKRRGRPPANATEPEKRGRGRPVFKPTDELRERVEVLIAGGLSVEGVAADLRVDKKTLMKHFREHIENGRSRKMADVIFAMFKAAKDGNVAAQKAFIQMSSLAEADERLRDDKPADDSVPDKPKPVFKGKKEAAQEEAMTAGIGSEWGTDLDPAAPGPSVRPN